VTVVIVPENAVGAVVGAVVVAVVVVVVVVVVEVLVVPFVVGAAVVAAEREVPVHAVATSSSATVSMGRAGASSTATYATDPMRSRSPSPVALLTLLALVVVIGGCGGSWRRSTATTAARSTTTRPPVTSTTATKATVLPPPTTARATTTSTLPPPTAPPATPAPTTPTTTPATSPSTGAPLLVTRLSGVGNAGQVIAVSASGYGATTATFTAYQRTLTGWQQVFGPWLAHIGRNGFAPPGAKREGDGRTPSGSYGFSFFFGVNADPGVRFPYRSIPGPWIVWDDDPASANYNEWIDNRASSAGAAPEPMDVSAYAYGAVIDYNAQRAPGLGSAIFMHVSNGGSTAGCVSLPVPELLSVLRWLDPGRSPRIIMGTSSSITS
jgi:L,D-peptidoglycan transpeptidase YkuD (ErfK/YbiS/YcfS/YnhG family)